MFKTQDIIGDVVFISFNDGERYKDIGIKSPAGHFKVLGYDNVGIWVSHPYLIVSNSTSEDKNNKNVELESNFLITWDNIRTIMHYPDREGFDFPSEFDKNYGFKSKK
tara:strand:- start:546 stop:869 length:324 start_codon:yes stop_codon:yes gene_type:complete